MGDFFVTGPVTIVLNGTDPSLKSLLENVIMNQAQLATQLQALVAGVDKIGTETRGLITKISDLEAALNNAGEISAEVAAALDALKAQVDIVDALVPDAPEVVPTGGGGPNPTTP